MTTIPLKKIYSGKVRDLYEIDSRSMLIVASDRLSAFDVILNEPIPGKGEITSCPTPSPAKPYTPSCRTT